MPEHPSTDLALLRLRQPATAGLPLGYPGLVRVGDRVWVPADSPMDGLVDRLESFPEQDLRLFRVGMRLPATASGGQLVNDLGEVVGVLAIGRQSTDAAYALTVDVLVKLLPDSS